VITVEVKMVVLNNEHPFKVLLPNELINIIYNCLL